MSWTVGEFVNQAFEELGYSNYQFDLQPEQLQQALAGQDPVHRQARRRTVRPTGARSRDPRRGRREQQNAGGASGTFAGPDAVARRRGRSAH